MCFNTPTTVKIVTAVISIAQYLTDKGEHTALYKILNNVYIKSSKKIKHIVIILYSSYQCVCVCVCVRARVLHA